MKLNSDNKKHAGVKKSSRTYWEGKPLPDYMEEYIAKLPPSTQNNARKIVRADFYRILALNPMTGAKILAEKYDLHPDIDRSARDYGEPPEPSEEEKAFWASMPPQE